MRQLYFKAGAVLLLLTFYLLLFLYQENNILKSMVVQHMVH